MGKDGISVDSFLVLCIEELRRISTASLTENGKNPIFLQVPQRQLAASTYVVFSNIIWTCLKIFQYCVPENDTCITLNTEKKSFRSLVCLPVSKLAKMMGHSNYCHISWAKGGRSKCLINSFFPMGAINDMVRCILPPLWNKQLKQDKHSNYIYLWTSLILHPPVHFVHVAQDMLLAGNAHLIQRLGGTFEEQAFRELVRGSGNSRRAWAAAGQPVQTAKWKESSDKAVLLERKTKKASVQRRPVCMFTGSAICVLSLVWREREEDTQRKRR